MGIMSGLKTILDNNCLLDNLIIGLLQRDSNFQLDKVYQSQMIRLDKNYQLDKVENQ